MTAATSRCHVRRKTAASVGEEKPDDNGRAVGPELDRNAFTPFSILPDFEFGDCSFVRTLN